MNDLKPGIKTTEFWVTIFAGVAMLLVSFGLVTNAEISEIAEVISDNAEAVTPLIIELVGQATALVVAIAGVVKMVISYTRSRTDAKAGSMTG